MSKQNGRDVLGGGRWHVKRFVGKSEPGHGISIRALRRQDWSASALRCVACLEKVHFRTNLSESHGILYVRSFRSTAWRWLRPLRTESTDRDASQSQVSLLREAAAQTLASSRAHCRATLSFRHSASAAGRGVRRGSIQGEAFFPQQERTEAPRSPPLPDEEQV